MTAPITGWSIPGPWRSTVPPSRVVSTYWVWPNWRMERTHVEQVQLCDRLEQYRRDTFGWHHRRYISAFLEMAGVVLKLKG